MSRAALSAAVQRIAKNSRVRTFLRLGAAPTLIYFVCFSVLTFPLITRFSSHFFTDQGDGLQNVWNLWWVDKAVTELGQSPWHTDLLHHPWGISLLPHTLNAFNGFLGIGLQTFLTLKQTHNFIVVFAFVVAGLTMFHLAWHLVGSYWPSIVAGFIFAFSNYHFAHAEGHMQLVSLEWIPLFLLCWHLVVTRPSLLAAGAAGAALFAVILCDYYYFFYCVIAGALMLFGYAWRSRSWRFLVDPPRLRALALFVGVVLVTAGPLVFSLLWLNAHDPLYGGHDAHRASADLLGAFIPGGHWRFAEWTRFYWWRLPGNFHEKSIHLGLSVIALVVWTGLVRRRVRFDLAIWFVLLAVFWLLALGPRLQVFGYEISWLRMPYALLELLFPPIRMSGVPVRMSVMTTLAAALISAAGLELWLASGHRRHRLVAVAFVGVLLFEYWPRPIPSNPMPVPDHVQFLAALPADRIIVDRASSQPGALYHQTLHGKRMALGYVSRYPQSIVDNEDRLKRLARRERFAALRSDYGIHYFLKKGDRGQTLVIDTATGDVVFPALR